MMRKYSAKSRSLTACIASAELTVDKSFSHQGRFVRRAVFKRNQSGPATHEVKAYEPATYSLGTERKTPFGSDLSVAFFFVRVELTKASGNTERVVAFTTVSARHGPGVYWKLSGT